MTENQEKELFTTLATLVKGVNQIQTDVQGLKTDVEQIKETQEEHSLILKEHSQILSRLDAKTDSIAETVLNHEIRITKLEKDVSDSQKGVH